MEPAVSSPQIYKFGLFEADVARNTLTRNGVRVRIQDQPFRALVLLLERPGEIVNRDDLRQKLWPEGTFVDFDGSLNVILKKLRATLDDDSDNPRFIETVPRRGYRFIAPVAVSRTESEAAAKPSAPTIRPSAPVPVTPAVAPASVPRPRRRPYLIYACVAAGLLLVVTGIWFFSSHGLHRSFGRASGASVPVRKSAAVLGFHNISGRPEDAWMGTAFSEMLSTELAGGEKLRLISAEEVANLRHSAPWSQTDTLDQATTSRIGTALDSDLLVLGSYTSIGGERGQLRVDVRLQDAKTGEILAEIAESGGAQELFTLVTRVGEKLRNRIGVPQLGGADEAAFFAALPLDREAAKFYALGIAKLRDFDALAAKDLLEEATKSDPKFSLGHAMLARAYSQLGYEQKRREEAKKALDLSGDLPRAQRMLVEGEYYKNIGNQDRAAAIYHTLFQLFPDNVEYGLLLASAQRVAGRGSEALATTAQLRRLPPPASDDPAIDLEQARNEPKKADSLALIHVALTKADALGKKLVYAQARHDECITLVYGENPQEALAACDDAYNSFLSSGNRLAAADTLRLIADRQGAQGSLDQSLSTYQRALDMLQALGDHEKTGAVLNNMGSSLMNRGDLDRAESLLKQAKFHFDQAGDRHNASVAITNLADVLYLRGQLSAAALAYQQAIHVVEALDPPEPSYLLYRLGDLELAQGKPEASQKHAQEAIDSLHGEAAVDMSSALVVLAESLQAQANLDGARTAYEKSLAIRQRLGDLTLVAETQVEIADLLLEENQPFEAEKKLREAISQFEQANSPNDASNAYTLLSKALLAGNKVEEAKVALDRAIEFGGSGGDPSLKLALEIQRSLVASAQGLTGAAKTILEVAIKNARKLGYYHLSCEARLALSELESRTSPELGRTQLLELAKETRSRGLELLAREAEQAAKPSTSASAKSRP